MTIQIERVRTLGYILPIRPIQSEQYANRLNMERYDFASVERLSPVKLDSDFLKEVEERIHLIENEDKEKEQNRFSEESSNIGASNSSSSLYPAYIVPNPINLSPAISNIVGKGIAINTYV